MFVLSITYPLAFWAVGLCFAVVFWLWPGKPRLIRLLLVGLVVTMTLGIHAIEYQNVPIKSFVQDLYSIRPGMTVAEVERIMGKYPRGTRWPANILAGPPQEQELTIPGALVFRPSTDGGDSNWGIVRIHEGRVAAVEFNPD
jgi:hypothetical protein